MRKNNSLIVGVAFATAMLAGAVIPVGGAQASPVYFEDFNSGFQGSSLGLSGADLSSDKYAITNYFNINNNVDGWSFTSGTYFAQDGRGTDGAVVLNENGGSALNVLGLSPNTQYQLSFLYYGDNRPGDIWGLHVDVNGSILDLSDTDNAPGTNPGTIATLLFLTNGAGDATVFFNQTTPSGSEASPIIDNVTVSETPIPAALPLFATGLGAFGLLGWRRKRKNAAARAAA